MTVTTPHPPAPSTRRPLVRARQVARRSSDGLLALFPEILVGLLLFDAFRSAHQRRLDGDDPQRGDAIQWVIVTAVGAAIAVTVGAIIYNKLENKANSIDVTTPGAR